MLQIEGITKVYKTGSLIQRALKGVSLNLRDSEFVAILGQSGSGKTTMLNIIGGLDRYDEGDLIINGISTKKYTDRDWDSYRNHTVGFVFQSYNLIPHQTILSNVELALTISGISSGERAQRAREALEKVGLSEHIHKKPSQLSGGQMQRVAIARALVNDPDILLADEPTGALDSETSIQVMDLLKEVASDRLVVMVTHNPELAEKYATRIVTLMDGKITSDSDPFEPETGETVHKNLGRSSMSLMTSLALSFNNLWTKKARTILVSFAGSIGIIGIAMILSMSHGANEYIRSVEEESLQEYPLQITDTNLSLTSMYATGLTGMRADAATDDEKDVSEWSAITNILSGVTANDLKSLKEFFESGECDIDDYVQNIEYSYNIVPRIYKENDSGYRQVNPNNSFAALGFTGSETSTNGLFSSFSNSDTFFQLSEKEELYKKSFDLKAGKWPESYDECIVTLTTNGRVSDITLYTLGLKDPKELDDMVNAFAEGSEFTPESTSSSYDYEDFIGIEFKLVSTADFYTYDKNYDVWTDHSSDGKYMKELLKSSETLKVVGVAQVSEESSSTTTDFGIGYPVSLTKHVIETAAESDIVKAQLANPDIDVFTGKAFEDNSSSQSDVDLASLFSVDKEAISKTFDLGGTGLDLSGLDLSSLDMSSLDFADIDISSAISADAFSGMMPELSKADLESLLKGIDFNITSETLKSLFEDILSGYQIYAGDDKRTDISSLPSALLRYLRTEDAMNIIRDHFNGYISRHSEDFIKAEDIAKIAESYIMGYSDYLSQRSYEQDDYTHIRDYINSDEAKKILQDGVDELREKIKKSKISDEEINAMTADIVSGYEKYADENELPSASYLLNSFIGYLGSEEAQTRIGKTVSEAVDASGLEESMSKYSAIISAQMGEVMERIFGAVGTQITSSLESGMSSLTSGLSDNLMSAFDFDTDALADMFKTEMTAEELKDLMTSLFSTQKTTFDGNLKKLGYADLAKPSAITIYPKDFDSKTYVKNIISDYNKRMQEAGEDNKVIEYTDLVDALMGSVTTIIDAISYVLIAFVAISLVVSSIMIGVITYISVLERKKEIGILRAIGASKRNISNVFNAETFIIGALAGVIGIGVTELLIIPANMILHALTEQNNINAILPPAAAVILIFLSIGLTLIGGIIPSRKAAKSDPVAALRSE